MASTSLFKSIRGWFAPAADSVNDAGGIAYRLTNEQALAQHAVTGCLNGTFYASAETQLATILKLSEHVPPEFLARTALYARRKSRMKDLPALLCAVLSVRGPGLMAEIFDRVIDSPKMLRNFVQIMRSGAVGRKSLGTLPKRLVAAWIEQRSDDQLFIGSVGNDPSLADIIKMVHPKPHSASREALYGYLIGRTPNAETLPPLVRSFEAYKAAADRTMLTCPDVPFQLLTALKLSSAEWTAIARRASWQTTRINLNTFARHRVFDDADTTRLIAERLRDAEQIRRAQAMPYQLMAAWASVRADVPASVKDALQEALNLALNNVPAVDGRLVVLPDVSGSMHSPLTGHRRGATSVIRCVDVASLVAAALLRSNPETLVIPFESKAIPPAQVGLNPRDSVLTNASRLAALPSGGTNCSAPLAYLNEHRLSADVVIYVSDNESWMDSPADGRFNGNRTQTMNEWATFKHRNPQARMICIDLQPNATTQAKERSDVINVGGFSDAVFDVIAAVARREASAGYWVKQIEAVEI